MLVNLKIKPNQRTKWQKFCREGMKDPVSREFCKGRKNHFNWIIRPYKPCGREYIKDTTVNFTGVYIDVFGIAENYLPVITYNKIIESLVWYGCVDNASQAINKYNELKVQRPELIAGNHIIILTPVFRENAGGFRWHKNGYYQGAADAGNCEYFKDEIDDLKMVYIYNIIQVSKPREEDFGDAQELNAGRIPSVNWTK